MDSALSRVMDARLGDMLARWRVAVAEGNFAEPLAQLAPHRDHMLVLAVEPEGIRYLHYGSAFVAHFGVDLTGQVVAGLAPEIISPDRRGMLEFDYTLVQARRSPLWRSYTADFGPAGLETWQRLVLPTDDDLLVVGAYPVEPTAPRDEAERLLRLVIERVPVVLDRDGVLCDLALSLRDYNATRRHAAELEILANHDPLTGIANLRHFHRLAGLEIEHARRMNRSMALLALDLDHFKRINDQWGHAAGDLALKSFAATCRATLREPDILGRCGGEEFAVALPNTGLDGALVIAERLRRAVEVLAVPQPGGPPLSFTVSIGIAVAAPGSDQPTEIVTLLAQADKALYASKTAGRNRVSVAGE